MADADQLLRGGEPESRPRADNGDALVGPLQGGSSGTIQPSSHARSTMVFSMFLIVTGGSLMPSTQAASHGAGQMRPVNSGKLFVECRTRIASFQRPCQTRSFQSGMMF